MTHANRASIALTLYTDTLTPRVTRRVNYGIPIVAHVPRPSAHTSAPERTTHRSVSRIGAIAASPSDPTVPDDPPHATAHSHTPQGPGRPAGARRFFLYPLLHNTTLYTPTRSSVRKRLSTHSEAAAAKAYQP